jgi:hypothetical protein
VQNNNGQLSYILEESWMDIFIQTVSIRLARVFLNPSPKTLYQRSIKFLLGHLNYLRKKIMNHASNYAEVDIYNLQAIEILERAGISEPSEHQIIAIERLLKAA